MQPNAGEQEHDIRMKLLRNVPCFAAGWGAPHPEVFSAGLPFFLSLKTGKLLR